jgi:hypothetical protein
MFLVKTIDETINLLKENFNNYNLKTKTILLRDALNYVIS